MKRTTLYLPPELEVRLKMEAIRRKQPMAEFVREAVEAYLSADPVDGPPGAGAFASGHADTADRAEELLAATGFGADAQTARKRAAARPATARPRATPARSRRRP
jgi:hypothetical protein